MEDLESRWITGKDKIPCKADDDAPVRLGLMNMRGLKMARTKLLSSLL